jgi:hypothetical protein
MMQGYKPRAVFNDRRLAVIDIETISSEVMENGAFPPWPTPCAVIASILTADYDTHGMWHFAIESVRFMEDRQPLERIDELLRGRSAISYNAGGFDFRVLVLLAQASRKFCLPALMAAAAESRYVSARHVDLADKYSHFGAARGASLAMLCERLGIAAKIAAHGDEVGQLYDQGEIEKISEYCQGDVASTLLLHAHFRAMEKGDPGYHASLTYQFTRWVLDQQLEHLKPFADIRLLDDLLRQSLIVQIDAAFANARVDADLTERRALDASFAEAVSY